jgi:hypothetical protein
MQPCTNEGRSLPPDERKYIGSGEDCLNYAELNNLIEDEEEECTS